VNIGTTQSVQALTLEDVRKFYADYYSPKIASIVAVSDFERPALFGKLDAFRPWKGGEVSRKEFQAFPENGETKIYLVNKPGAAQSEIRIGKRSLNYDATGEFYRAGLMNFVLGGAFNSRINLNLREDKGYSYGARSGFDGEEDYGVFTARAGVRTDATSASIIEFEKEIRQYVEDGITEPELTFTRNAIGQRDARRYETPTQKIVFLSRIVTFDLDEDFVDRQNEILQGISQKEINQLAGQHLNMDEMLIVVVGDKETILPGLEELGYEIVELNADAVVL